MLHPRKGRSSLSLARLQLSKRGGDKPAAIFFILVAPQLFGALVEADAFESFGFDLADAPPKAGKARGLVAPQLFGALVEADSLEGFRFNLTDSLASDAEFSAYLL